MDGSNRPHGKDIWVASSGRGFCKEAGETTSYGEAVSFNHNPPSKKVKNLVGPGNSIR